MRELASLAGGFGVEEVTVANVIHGYELPEQTCRSLAGKFRAVDG